MLGYHVRLNRTYVTLMHTGRGLRLFALVCVLMMPLQFKGGAADSHSHAFFQFWSNAETAPHHHGNGEDGGVESHDHRFHEHPADTIKLSSIDAQLDDAPSVETSVGPPGLIGIGQVAGFALTLFLATLFATSELGRVRLSALATMIGRAVLPLVPPPRMSS